MARLQFPALMALALLALVGPHPSPAPAVPVRLAPLPRPAANELRGVARVTDGDTLRIGATRIRLFGIDAPESHQRCPDREGHDWPCGTVAAERLEALVANRTVRCKLEGSDRYGRSVARCSVEGRDLGATIVGEGLARAYARYSEAYIGDEAAARAAGRGLWQAEAEAPWDWRRHRGRPLDAAAPRPTVAAAAPAPGCEIKGNISGDGRRLYHTPGMASWSRTRIDPGRGERFFCGEAEARAAGWLPAAGGGGGR